MSECSLALQISEKKAGKETTFMFDENYVDLQFEGLDFLKGEILN